MEMKTGYRDYVEQWKKLLSAKRIKRDWTPDDIEVELENPDDEEFRHPFEADVHRIQFSAPFRRLAGKTQVHPFAEVDFIHNRLTHSVEVASVCRSLARRVGKFIYARGDFLDKSDIDKLGWIATVGGLGHDIGNPPYGHAGESAIQAWAKEYSKHDENKELLPEDIWLDFKRFDGNAQAFRMLSRPDVRSTSYFRLTVASLGALVKYPYDVAKVADTTHPKFNCFASERKTFETVMKELGLYNPEVKSYLRHPVSYITEAADDICYRISDFEDAVLMRLLPENVVRELFLDGLEYADQQKYKAKPLSHIRSKVIGLLIAEFAKQFEDHYDTIMEGSLEFDLKKYVSPRWHSILCRIKEMYETIFAQRTKIVEEIGCYGQISTVMTLLFNLLHEIKGGCSRYNDLTFRTQRIVELAWGKEYFKENSDKPLEWWAHAILDHVAGMTDSYLNRLSNELR